MATRVAAAAFAVLGLACSEGAPETAATAQTADMSGGESREQAVAAISAEDTIARSRLLESSRLKCYDGTELMAMYWDAPAARVTLASPDRSFGSLSRVGEPKAGEGILYADSTSSWQFLGDSAIWQRGNSRQTCREAEDVLF
jgi:hypothetical protein